MPAAVTLSHLAPMCLPEGWGLRRDPVYPPRSRTADHDARYDWTTLFYGAAWRADRRALVLVGPPLLNLSPLLAEGHFLSALGRHVLRRHRRFPRWDEVWLDAPLGPDAVVFECRGERLEMPVEGPLPGFAGRRCVIAKSRDNELAWIADWARHLVAHQGARAMLFIDNGSTRYPPGRLADLFEGIPGLEAARVVSAAVPFGVRSLRPASTRAHFLQDALLNLARHGWLRHAGTVMHCDIDELPVSDGPTLFERAEASRLGYATARCHWRYRDGAAPDFPRFCDHVMRMDPPTRSKEKWVVRPSGPLGDTVWQTHGVARYWLNRPAMDRGSRFYHCESIATNWKRDRSAVREGLVRDGQTVRDYARVGLCASEMASETSTQPVKR